VKAKKKISDFSINSSKPYLEKSILLKKKRKKDITLGSLDEKKWHWWCSLLLLKFHIGSLQQ
jgi:hypothetical protein